MNMGSRFLSLLLLPLVFQSPQDRLKQHYEAAEAQARAGNFAEAETEYAAILAEGYRAIGRIYSAQQKHKQAIAAVEAAALYQPASDETLSDLAITYFEAGLFDKALQPLNQAIALNPQSPSAHSMLGKTYLPFANTKRLPRNLKWRSRLARMTSIPGSRWR